MLWARFALWAAIIGSGYTFSILGPELGWPPTAVCAVSLIVGGALFYVLANLGRRR